MPALRAITVSVGYAPLLAITLIRNQRNFTHTLVVTSPDDHGTVEVARAVPGVSVFKTDAFTRPDANGVRPRMNKGLAIEEAFDHFGRTGWLAIIDADTLWPDVVPLDQLDPTRLHGARRRILEDPTRWSPTLDWSTCAVRRDGGPVGFTQIFHADDPAIRDKRPWYDVSFSHAGGGDAYMLGHWPASKKVVLNFDVLHLGPCDRHWFGTDPASIDLMSAFVHRNQWRNAMVKHDPTACDRVGEIVERVNVPGYEPSSFELPFVRRAKSRT